MKNKPLVAGAVAGLLAGVVMGIMMIVMMGGTEEGVINMIASLYGGSSATLGFIAHLIHSALIGALFGLLFKSFAKSKVSASIAGLVYGFIWWILGPLFIMPLWLAGAIRLAGEAGGIGAAVGSIPGHLVYGLLLGFLFAVFYSGSKEEVFMGNAPENSEQNGQTGE